MNDICKCGHREEIHWVMENEDGVLEGCGSNCVCSKYASSSSEMQRMADVVSAALRFSNDLIDHADDDCDCATCTLKRACDKYTAEEK